MNKSNEPKIQKNKQRNDVLKSLFEAKIHEIQVWTEIPFLLHWHSAC